MIKLNIKDGKITATQTAQQADPATVQQTMRTTGALYGTGITKRLLQTAAKKTEQIEAQEIVLQQDANVNNAAANGDDAPYLALPSTLAPKDLELDPDQDRAVNGLLREQYGCLIGSPGTGKTTSVKVFVQRLVDDAIARGTTLTIKFVAYTGRAVQQIKRVLPPEYQTCCDTIHGFLEFAPCEEEVFDTETQQFVIRRPMRPRRTELNKVTETVIFVDESSMVPIQLWNQLIVATPATTRIYLIGDLQQLPPPMGQPILGYAGLTWPAFELTRMHRTNENALLNGLYNIISGKKPEPAKSIATLYKLDDDVLNAYSEVIKFIITMHRAKLFDPLRDAIIVPQNIDTLGQEHLNERLCLYFNPAQRDEHGHVLNPRVTITAGYAHRVFGVGDKVMVTKNDRKQGLTNGMLGIIESIKPNAAFRGDAVASEILLSADKGVDFTALNNGIASFSSFDLQEQKLEDDDATERQASHIVTIRFQNMDTPIEFATAGAINTIQLAYAMTCYKSQGGEWHTVVMVCHSANNRMLSREWLTTAWSRAQKHAVLLHNTRGLDIALNRQIISGSTLEEKLRKFIALGKDLETTQPLLPPATKIVE